MPCSMTSKIIKLLGVNNSQKSSPRHLPLESAVKTTLEQGDPELQSRLESLKIPLKNVLGKNYLPKKRHKAQPTEIKQKIIQNQCVAYSSLPYSELEKLPDYPMPAVLAKRHHEKQDTAKNRGSRNRRDESDLQATALGKRLSCMPR